MRRIFLSLNRFLCLLCFLFLMVSCFVYRLPDRRQHRQMSSRLKDRLYRLCRNHRSIWEQSVCRWSYRVHSSILSGACPSRGRLTCHCIWQGSGRLLTASLSGQRSLFRLPSRSHRRTSTGCIRRFPLLNRRRTARQKPERAEIAQGSGQEPEDVS